MTTTNERVNVHVQLSVVDVLALDLMATVKTEIGPATWSRAACVREAIREYVKARKIVGEPGSFQIVTPGEAEEIANADAAYAAAQNTDLFGTSEEDLPLDAPE